MKTEEIHKKLIEKITPLVEDMGYELFDIKFARGKNRSILRIFIDKDNGVAIEDCESVSREVSNILDLEDIIPASYLLEVSSPGLDRPIRNLKEFKKAEGKMVRIVTTEPIDKQTFFQGRLEGSDDNGIELLLIKDKKVNIPYNIISQARLEIEF
jgi:ribosome maturation factor RimP